MRMQAQIIHTVPTAEGAHFCYKHLLYNFTKYLYEIFEVFDDMQVKRKTLTDISEY